MYMLGTNHRTPICELRIPTRHTGQRWRIATPSSALSLAEQHNCVRTCLPDAQRCRIHADAERRSTDVARTIASGQCLAGGSTVAVEHSARAVRLTVAGWNLASRLLRWAAGSFIFCEAAAFRAIGGFDLRWYAGEEVDLFRRLKRLARTQGRSIRSLSDHPLQTSARKAHLYSPSEFLMFQLKTIVTAGRNLRSADGSHLWYDGRR